MVFIDWKLHEWPMISSLWSSLLNNHSALLTLSTLCCGSRQLYWSQLGWKHDLEACNKAIPKFSLEKKSGRHDQRSYICCFVWALQILENLGDLFPQEMKKKLCWRQSPCSSLPDQFQMAFGFSSSEKPNVPFPKTYLVWQLLNLHSAVTAWLV